MTEGSDINYWTLVTIIGPILLLAALIWAISRNKKSSRASKQATERSTKENYADEQRAHQNDPGSGL
jgi:hypothetical protein